MSEEIIVYRFGNSEEYTSHQVMECHFRHLKENGTLLFTTSSTVSATNQKGRRILFTDREKSSSFQAIIVDSGQFGRKSPTDTAFKVPKEFEIKLKSEIESEYKWFALQADRGTLSYEKFEKGMYRLSRTDVHDSLGENQTPFRYAVPIKK